MAENGAKPERRQIEMSIWFVILLIVVIVFMCFLISKNNTIKELESRVTTLSEDLDESIRKNEERANLVKDLVDQVAKGNITNNQILQRLGELGYNVSDILNSTTPVSEPVSGDVVSGEVTE